MIKPEMIPDEVERAYVSATFRSDFLPKDVIAAAINAWPGVRMMVDIDTGDDSALKLPLPEAPQECGVSPENSK